MTAIAKAGENGLASMLRMIVVATVLIMAGCSEPAPAGSTEHEAGHAQHMMQNVTFHDAVIDATTSFTGAFQTQDHGTVQATSTTTGQPNTAVQSHDISDLLPRGVPVFVEARVESGAVITWVGADDFSAIWTSQCDECTTFGAGTGWSGAVLNTGQSFTLNAFYPGGTVPSEMPYELSIRVSAAPDHIPTGIALEVDMPQVGNHILFEGEVTDVMVFDPEDQYVGLLPAGDPQMYIEENMSTGAYVFMPVGHGGFYKLRSGADVAAGDTLAVKARILTQEIRTTGPHPVTQNTDMTFDLERQPLQMGVAYFGTASQDASVRLESPGGVRVETGHQGLVAGGVGGFQQTPMGDPRLTAGTYTLTWEDTVNDGSMQVQEFFTLYAR